MCVLCEYGCHFQMVVSGFTHADIKYKTHLVDVFWPTNSTALKTLYWNIWYETVKSQFYFSGSTSMLLQPILIMDIMTYPVG